MSSNTISYDTNSTMTTDALFQVFTQSNIVIIVWFLAVYFVVYLMLNIFRGKGSAGSSISRWIDIVSLICILIFLAFTYFGKSDSEKQRLLTGLYSNFESTLNSPYSLISVAFFILTLYIVIYILAIPMDSTGKPITVSIIENLAWIMFLIILFANFLRYVAGISLTGFIDNVGDYLQNKAASVSNPVVTTGGNVASSSTLVPVQLDEVFNIGNNMFTYDDAQSVCASYGARLATYDEIESTYNNGGEWCNYGWSDGQAAYFPTQKKTWQKLQGSEQTKNVCGRPGVNGGFIEDSNARFGVNCFGKKPKPTSSDLAAISSGISVPKSQEDILLEKKIEFWKANGDKLFKINGYNNNKWSMY